MASPDTTGGAQLAAWSALKNQWDEYGHSTMTVAGIAAKAALAYDRKALAEQGYAIVKVGDVPPWMREAENVYIRLDRPDNPLIDGQYLLVGQVYVIETVEIEDES
jgi:hypothetical protein